MTPADREQYKRLARELATGSVVTDALARLLEQVIEETAQQAKAQAMEQAAKIAEGFSPNAARAIRSALSPSPKKEG